MRSNSKYPAHADTAKQSRRLKLTAVRAKIVWVGKLSHTDREVLLMGLNTGAKSLFEHVRKELGQQLHNIDEAKKAINNLNVITPLN